MSMREGRKKNEELCLQPSIDDPGHFPTASFVALPVLELEPEDPEQ